MERMEFEEWGLAPDSLFPGWHFVEEFINKALGAGGVDKIYIFEFKRSPLSRYELTHTHDRAGNQGAALGAIVRDALRRRMFLGLVLRDPRGLAPLLANYRKEYREVLQLEDVMRKLGAEVSGLETVLAVEGRIVLVGHDGEPVFTLSAS